MRFYVFRLVFVFFYVFHCFCFSMPAGVFPLLLIEIILKSVDFETRAGLGAAGNQNVNDS